LSTSNASKGALPGYLWKRGIVVVDDGRMIYRIAVLPTEVMMTNVAVTPGCICCTDSAVLSINVLVVSRAVGTGEFHAS
jgi:hypothetical protein